MKIKQLNFENIRNHNKTQIKFSNSLNVFYGENGSGKTSILEAISIASFSTSFMSSQEINLINFEKDFYFVHADLERDNNTNFFIKVRNSPNTRKKISSSFADNMIPKDLIGNIPLVILSPDLKNITFGSPENRRNFIDRILSQANKSYLYNLLNFRKVLKNRNSLLIEASKTGKFDKDIYNILTEKYIELSADIIFKRFEFIENLRPTFKNYYNQISGEKETVDIIYNPYKIYEYSSKEKIKEELILILNRIKDIEFLRKTTLFGPQKDDLIIMINNGIAREIASQGQHKSLLISLKFAEFDFIKSYLNETPIILLDDIFSELDRKRIKFVLDLIKEKLSQSFITLTEKQFLSEIISNDFECNYYSINSGSIVSIEEF